MSKKCIAVFNEALQLEAAIHTQNRDLIVVGYNNFDDLKWAHYKAEIMATRQYVHTAVIRPDTDIVVDALITAKPGHAKFLEATAHFLSGRFGLSSHLVPQELITVLVWIGEAGISTEERKLVVGDIVNLSDKDALVFSKAIFKVKQLTSLKGVS